jgi:glutamyl-tRNA reductase
MKWRCESRSITFHESVITLNVSLATCERSEVVVGVASNGKHLQGAAKQSSSTLATPEAPTEVQ